MKHLSDETLVLLLDRELPLLQQEAALFHIDHCGACRDRRDALQAVMLETAVPQAPPPRHEIRDLLAVRLAHAATHRSPAWLRPRLLLQAAMVLALVATGFVFRQMYWPGQDSMAAYEETGPEPDHAITPGSVRTVDLTELCIMADDDLDPVVAPEKQRAVFAAYGLNQAQTRAYQVDYLINPQLGGNDALENLWPEPYHATVWNAQAKDALEARLHGMVCSGQIGLDEAQREIAADWVGAYKRVFHANRPVRVQAAVESSPVR